MITPIPIAKLLVPAIVMVVLIIPKIVLVVQFKLTDQLQPPVIAILHIMMKIKHVNNVNLHV